MRVLSVVVGRDDRVRGSIPAVITAPARPGALRHDLGLRNRRPLHGPYAELPPAGVYVMAATMFGGRVGTVTLAAALAHSQRRQLFQYPEERPIVG